MDSKEIKKAIRIFYPAIVLDSILSRESREVCSKAINIILVILSILALGAFGGKRFPIASPDISFWVHQLESFGPLIIGLLFIVLALSVVASMFKAFYDSYYFTGLNTTLSETGLSDNKPSITFEAASVLYNIFAYADLTKGFVGSRLGQYSLARVGIGEKVLANFFSHRSGLADPALCTFPKKVKDEPISLGDVATALMSLDQEFARALSLKEVSTKDLSGSADWVERMEIYFRHRSRFWGKDALGRIPGIGKNWAYGGAYTLEKFAHDITDREIGQGGLLNHSMERDELEAVLARSSESNALLVADEGAGALEVVFGLGARIAQGSVLPSLEHKRIFFFDTGAFIAALKDKAKFESEFLHILNESVHAGNIILVISDLPNFIESAKSLGSNVIALMDPYLASADFQVIATANPWAFHEGLEENSKVLHRFEKILVKENDLAATMRILEDQALLEEARSGVFFTYQSLEAVALGVKRYFTEGVSSDKAFHLLSELVPVVEAQGKNFVERSDVLSLIETKTGIKTGAVKDGERTILLKLEEILSHRIIGQDEAVKAISNAMRRARSDIENPGRPMGSFLFLGPTGVGKTETTKALAATFFGQEESIIRFDMSEYQTDDALKRLIGSFENGKPGVLSSKLRDQRYGVLLLDEFEKTNTEVLNLFLQVLDEGFFSDVSGHRVNARNLIIIATSNAGSDMIWSLMKSGKDLNSNKESIINEIIGRNIFRPELLNRFDGVILFHPLSTGNLRKIAELMLEKLKQRLMDKGIELVINESLIKAVVAVGTDQEFGARAMNRAIAEKVEQVIAKKMIAGEVKSGSRLELTERELQ
ncbi:MAG: AAA family ATPase [Candidatus Liptonbacteria bacterium]|nr:AAA family ATPase [Candidatus Liptonbacteria bacterium]